LCHCFIRLAAESHTHGKPADLHAGPSKVDVVHDQSSLSLSKRAKTRFQDQQSYFTVLAKGDRVSRLPEAILGIGAPTL
jgi:hypothetical protein